MMTLFQWNLTVPPEEQVLGLEGEHLTRTLRIQTDGEPDWGCKLDLEYQDGRKNVVELTREGEMLTALLTRADLSVPGLARVQVRGLRGERERRSNTAQLFIPPSINAPGALPPLEQGEFARMEARITQLKTQAEQAALHPPVPRSGTWWIWDGGEYIDTARPYRGEPGPKGEPGEPGRGLVIQGYVDTPDKLAQRAPRPLVGEAWGVGASAPYDIYVYIQGGWVNNGPIQGPRGETGPQGAPGQPGARGEPGVQGEPGVSATVAVGLVSGGEQAQVLNRGTAQAAVLDFTLPAGPRGPQGATGPAGAAGPRGEPGAPGADGPRGETGAPGVSATIAVGLVSGGEQAQVLNRGTAQAAVLDFILPAGPRGAQGATGPAGEAGPRGEPGAPGADGPRGEAGAPGKSAYQTAVEAGYGGTEGEFCTQLSQVGGKQNRPLFRTVTLPAGNWVLTGEQWRQTAPVPGATAACWVTAAPDPGEDCLALAAQWAVACCGQDQDALTFTARLGKPTKPLVYTIKLEEVQ